MGYAPNSLTSCIYDMALGRSTWDNILDILSATFPECLVIVSGDDLAKGTNLAFAHRGLTPARVSEYLRTYGPQNPYLIALGGFATHQVYHDDQLLPREQAQKTPFVSEWLSRCGDFLAATGIVVLREGARQLSIEVRYPASRQGELRDRIGGVLGEASTHFGRGFEIANLHRFPGGQGYVNNVVEDLPFTVFFLDEDMRIHYSNYHAENFRRQSGSPFSSTNGVLRAADAGVDEMLRGLVRRTVSSKRPPTSVLQLTVPNSDNRYFAIARPAVRSGQHYQLHDAILEPNPLAMLMVHGSIELDSLPIDLLWRAFSFTESEARLAGALLGGATLSDFAREREVSKQTLRNQLVGVMRKTGTRRQPELVSLLTRLALTCL